MYRLDLRVFATLSALGALVACGSDAGTPGNSNPGATAGSTATAGTASAGSSSDPTGGAASAEGGTTTLAGSSTSTSGSANQAGSAGTSATVSATEYWIATDGADTNPGTEAAPFKTIGAGLTKVKPGLTLWVKPGTYTSAGTFEIGIRYSGTAAAPVTLQAAPGGRPVIDFSSQARGMDALRGFNLAGDFWHIKGLELTKASDNCIAVSGSNNVIEDVIVHECGDTGIQITAPSDQATDQTRAANNQILNCDSWGNLDVATGGENADGFAAKLRIGPGNSFKGCRAWNNADDGWDFFAADDVVKIDSSWAFSNGKPIGGSNPQGDGNGFKLGGAPDGAGQGGAVHLVTGSFAFENKACGFVRNNNPVLPKLTGCGAKDNKDAYCNLTVSGEVTMSMTAAAAITAKRSADGSLPKP
jgi:pectate disaccharide-lyase